MAERTGYAPAKVLSPAAFKAVSHSILGTSPYFY